MDRGASGAAAACHAAAPGAAGPGRAWLASLELPAVSREIIDDCLALTDAVAGPIGRLDEEVRQHAKADPRVRVLTQLPGVGQYTALVLLAEIGDITRFGSARKLASWAGLTPTVRGSDRTVHHGHTSKQGPAWAPVGAVRGRADRQAAPWASSQNRMSWPRRAR